MKNKVKLNSYPANYVEENLPDVIVEIRYKKNSNFNRKKAVVLAEDIKEFLDNWLLGWE